MLKYFISREFLYTVLGLFGLGILIYLLTFFLFLPAYTRYGDSILVPDVSNLTYEEASGLLKEAGLRSEVRDSVFRPDLEPLSVLKQYPLPMSTVKPKRRIYLTVNKSSPPIVKLPEVINVSVYQAKAKLESWKLAVGTITYVPDFAKDVVLDLKYKGKAVKAGAELPQGAELELVVGEGLKMIRTFVPNVMGLSYEDAVAELRRANLGLGSVVYNPDGPAEKVGTVYDQQPKPVRDSVRQGWPVDIFIYGAEPEVLESVDREGEGDGN
jgi:beta-lactam-binding protein with PASTA domain